MPQEETFAATPHWPLPQPKFTLADNVVHVWSASLDKFIPQFERFSSTLCASEREQAQRFHFDRHRQWFIIRRGLLRILLGRYLDVEPSRLVFAYDPRGKPSVSEPHHPDQLYFNVSDSSGLALYAVSRCAPVGVDVERIKSVSDMDGIAARFFSAREKKAVSASSEPQKAEAFFNCWTRKEAYLKATGEGISESLPRVEVTLVPEDAPQLLSIAGDTQAAAKWTIFSFVPASGFVGALAIRATGLTLSCWRCPES